MDVRITIIDDFLHSVSLQAQESSALISGAIIGLMYPTKKSVYQMIYDSILGNGSDRTAFVSQWAWIDLLGKSDIAASLIAAVRKGLGNGETYAIGLSGSPFEFAALIRNWRK